jgi:multisubunit Na+/H+ antiporter MnhF subunit
MSIWLWGVIAMMLGVVPCALLILRSPDMSDWTLALQMSGIIVVLGLLLLAQAMKRPSFYDLAVALALLSFPAGLMFAHFIERWFR